MGGTGGIETDCITWPLSYHEGWLLIQHFDLTEGPILNWGSVGSLLLPCQLLLYESCKACSNGAEALASQHRATTTGGCQQGAASSKLSRQMAARLFRWGRGKAETGQNWAEGREVGAD